MEDNRKGTKIIHAFLLSLNGYVVFEDNWISENDKILYNQKNQKFIVLDFLEIEIPGLIHSELMPYINAWKYNKHSCVKLNKEVDLNDTFYTINL